MFQEETWKADKTADSLNQSLFGKTKTKKRKTSTGVMDGSTPAKKVKEQQNENEQKKSNAKNKHKKRVTSGSLPKNPKLRALSELKSVKKRNKYKDFENTLQKKIEKNTAELKTIAEKKAFKRKKQREKAKRNKENKALNDNQESGQKKPPNNNENVPSDGEKVKNKRKKKNSKKNKYKHLAGVKKREKGLAMVDISKVDVVDMETDVSMVTPSPSASLASPVADSSSGNRKKKKKMGGDIEGANESMKFQESENDGKEGGNNVALNLNEQGVQKSKKKTEKSRIDQELEKMGGSDVGGIKGVAGSAISDTDKNESEVPKKSAKKSKDKLKKIEKGRVDKGYKSPFNIAKLKTFLQDSESSFYETPKSMKKSKQKKQQNGVEHKTPTEKKSKNKEKEQISDDETPLTKKKSKKNKIKVKDDDNDDDNGDGADDASPEMNPQTSQERSSALRNKMTARLQSARFRWINEQLYTCSGEEAMDIFKDDKEAFHVYHTGFQSQVEKWPANPLDKIIEIVKKRPSSAVIADFGCGDAKLAQSVSNKVHSFDLVATNKHVTVCNIEKVPLANGSVDIAVYSLSLMGTNVTDFLKEGNRVLKMGGLLLIAEVTSRFEKLGNFIHKVEKLGFKTEDRDTYNKMFVLLQFTKTGKPDKARLPEIKLMPCLYKKR